MKTKLLAILATGMMVGCAQPVEDLETSELNAVDADVTAESSNCAQFDYKDGRVRVSFLNLRIAGNYDVTQKQCKFRVKVNNVNNRKIVPRDISYIAKTMSPDAAFALQLSRATDTLDEPVSVKGQHIAKKNEVQTKKIDDKLIIPCEADSKGYTITGEVIGEGQAVLSKAFFNVDFIKCDADPDKKPVSGKAKVTPKAKSKPKPAPSKGDETEEQEPVSQEDIVIDPTQPSAGSIDNRDGPIEVVIPGSVKEDQ